MGWIFCSVSRLQMVSSKVDILRIWICHEEFVADISHIALISSHILSPCSGRGGAVLGHLRRLYLHRLLLPLEHPGAEINTLDISVNNIYIRIYIYYNLIVTAVTIRSIGSFKMFEDNGDAWISSYRTPSHSGFSGMLDCQKGTWQIDPWEFVARLQWIA